MAQSPDTRLRERPHWLDYHNAVSQSLFVSGAAWLLVAVPTLGYLGTDRTDSERIHVWGMHAVWMMLSATVFLLSAYALARRARLPEDALARARHWLGCRWYAFVPVSLAVLVCSRAGLIRAMGSWFDPEGIRWTQALGVSALWIVPFSVGYLLCLETLAGRIVLSQDALVSVLRWLGCRWHILLPVSLAIVGWWFVGLEKVLWLWVDAEFEGGWSERLQAFAVLLPWVAFGFAAVGLFALTIGGALMRRGARRD